MDELFLERNIMNFFKKAFALQKKVGNGDERKVHTHFIHITYRIHNSQGLYEGI
jgi:hypothetical protein